MVITLVEVASRTLRDASLAVTDSFSVTELELRQGQLSSVVRTAQDGSLTRGEAALMQVLGAATARFALKRSTVSVKPNIQGDIDRLLQDGAALITALEETISGLDFWTLRPWTSMQKPRWPMPVRYRPRCVAW